MNKQQYKINKGTNLYTEISGSKNISNYNKIIVQTGGNQQEHERVQIHRNNDR